MERGQEALQDPSLSAGLILPGLLNQPPGPEIATAPEVITVLWELVVGRGCALGRTVGPMSLMVGEGRRQES